MKTRNAAVMVTRRCNMKCAHCSVESHPAIKLQPQEEELRNLVDQLIDAGLTTIQFTGGEPMLRQDLVVELMARAKVRGVGSALTSNGFWGKKLEVAERLFDALREAGMLRLAISYDRFHAEFQGPGPVLNIIEIATRRDFPVHINITRTAEDGELDEIVAPFQGASHAQLRFYDIQPVGFAKNLGENLRAQMDGFCSACEQVTLTDNGRVVACNGPSYFEPATSGLVLGQYHRGTSTLAEMIERHGSDPVLETIRTEGPVRLAEVLRSLPGFEAFPFREDYGGMCGLCSHINRDPEALAALREHFSQPAQAALLLAKRVVRDRAGKTTFHRDGTNERLGPIALLAVLMGTDDERCDRVLGRADLDWHRWMERLSGLGMMALLGAHTGNPRLSRWAPSFFLRAAEEAAALSAAALRDRQEEIRRALQAGRELGFQVEPWGSSSLSLLGGDRLPESIELVTTGEPARLEQLLRERLGPDRPIRVRWRPAMELHHPGAESTRPAMELHHPGAESTRPATELHHPGAESTRPAAEPRHPEAGSTRPATELLHPEADVQCSAEAERSASRRQASRVAEELLFEWRERGHRDAASVAWDLYQLARREGHPPVLSSFSLLVWAEARVLQDALSVELLRLEGKAPEGRRFALLTRALRSQLFREPRRRSNLWLAPTLPLLSWTSIFEVPPAALLSLRLLLQQSPAAGVLRGLGSRRREPSRGRQTASDLRAKGWREFIALLRADWTEIRTVQVVEKIGVGEGSPPP